MKYCTFLLGLALLAAGCVGGPPPGDPTPPDIAVSSAVHQVGFTTSGEISGWYVPLQRGQAIKYGSTFNLAPARPDLPSQPGLPYRVGTVLIHSQLASCDSVQHQLEAVPTGDDGADDQVITFVCTMGQSTLTRTYTVHRYAHTVDVSIQLDPPQPIQFLWPFGLATSQVPGRGLVVELGEPGGRAKQLFEGGRGFTVRDVSYVALSTGEHSGFTALLRPITPADGVVASEQLTAEANFNLPDRPILGLASDTGVLRFKIYGGPKELVRLRAEHQDDLPAFFQANFFGNIALGIVAALEWTKTIVSSWGLAIVLITIAFRLLVWPFMTPQMRTMKVQAAAMQQLKPELEKLKKKYKDQRELNRATMELYQKHGINPAAQLTGCLPLVLQYPVLIAFWGAFRNYEFAGQGFLWIGDLAVPNIVLGIIYLGAMVLQMRLSTTDRKMLQQQLIFTIMFIYLIFSFPAAVMLYWLVSTLMGILQQWVVNRMPLPQPA
ncbi:MAG: membrane protein insertase YidC, partial [Deinococcus sp.]|nr:membrane protein insertase YidC [Deinococcus sp.]